MLYILWESFLEVCEWKIVSDYIFPIVSGIILTFLTVNIIKYRDLYAEAFDAVNEVEMNIRLIPASTPYGEWKALLEDVFSRLTLLETRFQRAGHWQAGVKAAETYRYLLDAAFDAYDSFKEGALIPLDDGGVTLRVKNVRNEILSEQIRAEIIKKLRRSHKRYQFFLGAKPNIWALFDLMWIAQWRCPSVPMLRLANLRRFPAKCRRFWLRLVVCPTCHQQERE